MITVPGTALVRGGVHLLEERDRLEVLPPAVLVGHPLAVLAGVVQVQHRGHPVDAKAVDVELLEPVQRVGHEEVAHLERPWLKMKEPQSGCQPRRGSGCS
jgi:hypothetical protein